jgi:hypothetical protein
MFFTLFFNVNSNVVMCLSWSWGGKPKEKGGNGLTANEEEEKIQKTQIRVMTKLLALCTQSKPQSGCVDESSKQEWCKQINNHIVHFLPSPINFLLWMLTTTHSLITEPPSDPVTPWGPLCNMEGTLATWYDMGQTPFFNVNSVIVAMTYYERLIQCIIQYGYHLSSFFHTN